jgi:signal transduction histidine kinase/CheY-like chemotaxis protein
MKILNRQPPFIKFLLFALVAITINLVTSYVAGFEKVYTTVIYATGTVLVVCFIAMYKMGYTFAAKLSATIFFNAFFFTFSYVYGLQSMAFIFYFPFLISFIYMYKDSATKTEAKVFTWSSISCILLIFIVCTMDGFDILTKHQQTIMYKRNFLVAFGLSAYYLNEIFSYLIVQMKLAQEASASKARFLSVMSHELRTPLNGIISAINLIDTTTIEEEKQKYSAVLKTSSEHLLHLVNNVLDYSKASSGKMELNLVSCSIEKILSDLEVVFQARFEEKDISLEVSIDEEVKRNVLLDDIRLEQVLFNLLSNALKFTEAGKVVVAVKCVGIKNSVIEVEVSVTDTGKGLTKDQQKKIFESFNNVYNKSRKVESAGLGLSICKMIVDMMGGTLLLESQVDKGSRFYFNITMPLTATEENKSEIIRFGGQSLEGATILIAEDNPINMMVTREFLKRWKVVILEAADGFKALQLLIQNPHIDLLLLDLQMPEMNGYELMEWIREKGLAFPVIAFTAQIMSNEEKKELMQLGFTDVIPKPFAPDELQQKLQTALQKRNQLMLNTDT